MSGVDEQVKRMQAREKQFKKPKTADDEVIKGLREEEMRKQKIADEELKKVNAKYQKYEAAWKKRLAEMDVKLTDGDEDLVREQVKKDFEEKIQKEKKKMERQLKKYEEAKRTEAKRREKVLLELEELKKKVERPFEELDDEDDDDESDAEYSRQQIEDNKKKSRELDVHLQKAKEQRHIEVLHELLKLKEEKLKQAQQEANPQESWEDIESILLDKSRSRAKQEQVDSFKRLEDYMRRKQLEERKKRTLEESTKNERKRTNSKWGTFGRRSKNPKVLEIKEDETFEEDIPAFEEGNKSADGDDSSVDSLKSEPEDLEEDDLVDFKNPGTWNSKTLESYGGKSATWGPSKSHRAAGHKRGKSAAISAGDIQQGMNSDRVGHSKKAKGVAKHGRSKSTGNIPHLGVEIIPTELKVRVKDASKLSKSGSIYVAIVPHDSNMEALRDKKTKIVKGSSDPEFNEEFSWDSDNQIKLVKFTVWLKAKRIGKSKCLGYGTILMKKRGEGSHSSRIQLKSRAGKKDNVGEGSLKISWTYNEL